MLRLDLALVEQADLDRLEGERSGFRERQVLRQPSPLLSRKGTVS